MMLKNVSKGVEKQMNNFKQECNLIWPLGRAIEQYLVKLKMYNFLTNNPSNFIYQRILDVCVQGSLFIEAVYVSAKIWKQPKCASIREEMNCGFHKGYVMERYATVKLNEWDYVYRLCQNSNNIR